MALKLSIHGVEARIDCLEMSGRERLGEALSFEIEAQAEEPLDTASLLGEACALHLETPHGERWIRGVVWSIRQVLTSEQQPHRFYRFVVRSRFSVLELRRRSTVFQKMTVPQIVQRVLEQGGFPSDAIEMRLSGSHPERRYVTQYDETDAAFIRRMCEEDGLWFRFVPGKKDEVFVLEDASAHAPAAVATPIAVVERRGVQALHLVAWDCREARRRRPGKVTLRAYDPDRPGLSLEGVAKHGSPLEEQVEIYAGAVGFQTPEEGARLAAQRLEAERASGATLAFHTNAAALFAGAKLEIALDGGYRGAARPAGEWFVTGIDHAWTAAEDRHEIHVEAIPRATPFRLPRVTPRPRAFGVHSAFVTGEPGEEIHTDDHGRIFVHFPWDREGPTDHTSSLPVRVMQPNMPGSMIIPRVGWEVWVMFEDGDPDRPYVIGRTYNARQPPPVSLPVNKTMTALQTYSSPGGKGKSAITFDDAAGRQHFTITAAKDKSIKVAHDAHVNTAKVENEIIGGNLTRSVGASETVSVKQAFVTQMASQTASVGASQNIFVKGNFVRDVKSETIAIGAALLEQVGNPVAGATNLATSAALAGVGSLGKLGPYLSAAGGLALGAYQGYKAGGARGAGQALGMGAAGMALGMIPGGDALAATVQGAASPAPWRDRAAPPGAQEAGGGAQGAANHGAAGGPGPGHKNQLVKGAMSELVGGSYTIATPGTIGWKTTGLSSFVVGGSHATKTRNASQTVMGVSTETLGALHVKSDQTIMRVVTGALKTTIGGTLKSTSGGPHNIKATGDLTIKVGGSMQMTGSIVAFVCGSSKVAASPGGVLVEASEITITGDSKQSSDTEHQ